MLASKEWGCLALMLQYLDWSLTSANWASHFPFLSLFSDLYNGENSILSFLRNWWVSVPWEQGSITYSSIDSSIHPCILQFIHLPIYSSICLSAQPRTNSPTHSSIHLPGHLPATRPLIHPPSINVPTHLFICSSIYSLTHWPSTHSSVNPLSIHPSIHPPIYSTKPSIYSIYPFIHSPTHSLIHPSVHPLSHLLMHSVLTRPFTHLPTQIALLSVPTSVSPGCIPNTIFWLWGPWGHRSSSE